jgi:hypothetical protein
MWSAKVVNNGIFRGKGCAVWGKALGEGRRAKGAERRAQSAGRRAQGAGHRAPGAGVFRGREIPQGLVLRNNLLISAGLTKDLLVIL